MLYENLVTLKHKLNMYVFEVTNNLPIQYRPKYKELKLKGLISLFKGVWEGQSGINPIA